MLSGKRYGHTFLALLIMGATGSVHAQPRADGAPFHVLEATIDGIHAELRSGRLSCVQLVQFYLNRIAAYDQAGPALNAVQNVNPAALKAASDRDAGFEASGAFSGPLHCIPVLVKDNVATDFMPTTYGSALFKTFVPRKNATIIERLHAAGAIILAKANMGEFSQGYSGSAFGDCRNAYDPRRSPSGSSCGTGVGIAANFAAVGIGEDSLGSIRGPASHGSLVGLRPTLQLVSRAGLIPFDSTRDTLGPITRTVRDAAIVLDAIAGYDPDDPITAWSYGQRPNSYGSFLVADGLAGMRVGVLRMPMNAGTDASKTDYKAVQAAVARAATDLIARSAHVIDPIAVPNLGELLAVTDSGGSNLEPEVDAFLAQQPNAPVRTLREIVASPLLLARRREELGRDLERSADVVSQLKSARAREELRTLVLRVMADNRLDALMYATFDHAPNAIPGGTPGSNRALASALGFPAMTVPAGFFDDGLPIGVEFLARPFAEGLLFKAAFDYEQTTRHRHPPPLTPALAREP
jgi:Asp-tRNA(Asn)/Glu-tRNA(Gln) amidotransferase A subunit family amidase